MEIWSWDEINFKNDYDQNKATNLLNFSDKSEDYIEY